MSPDRREVLGLAARALGWLPACLLAWYLASPVASWVPARLAAFAVGAAAGPVTSTSLTGARAVYELALPAPYRPGSRGPDGLATLEVNPRLYTFGLALFAALWLASPRPRPPRALAIGVAALLVIPAWGIAFDALRQLAAAPSLAPYLGWSPAAREAIAFAYQAGTLLLPSLAPVALWAGLDPRLGATRPPEDPAA